MKAPKLSQRKRRELQDELVWYIQAAETRAHDIGLHVSGRALNRAKNACGWEISGDVLKAAAASKPE
jgi:hypothetical protein